MSKQTWNHRDLSKGIDHPDNIVSVSDNQFTPIAGDYKLSTKDGKITLERVADPRIKTLREFGYSINPEIPNEKGIHLIIRDAVRGCSDGDTLLIPESFKEKIAVHDTSRINVVIDDRPYAWA